MIGINFIFLSGREKALRAPEHLAYITSPNNDIIFIASAEAKKNDLPDKVEAVIHAIVRKELQEVLNQCHPKECQTIYLEVFYGPVVKISAPRNLSLFVFTLRDYFNDQFGSYFLILYDPQRNRVSSEPISISGQELEGQHDPFFSKPVIFFEDLDEDGFQELVVQERIHRGTAYNAVVFHYFHFDNELSPSLMFNIEKKMLIPGEGGTLVRRSRKISKDNLEVEVYLQADGQQQRKIGEALYILDRNANRYLLQSKRSYLKKYEPVLISGAQGEIN